MSQADVPIDPDATRIRTAAGHCFRHRSDNVLVRPEIAIVANPASYFRAAYPVQRVNLLDQRRSARGQTRSFGDVRLNVRFARKRTRLGDLWARRYRVGTEGFLSTVATVTPNFALLEMSHPEVASLVAAMLQARDAVERRSWAHPQEPTGEEWWADVLDDLRARTGRDAQED
jgi:hypothetical protein